MPKYICHDFSLEPKADKRPSSSPLKLKAILIDLNGTLHVGHDATPKAVQAMQRLRRAGIPCVFWSANPRRDGTKT